jgi:hypothetical protein
MRVFKIVLGIYVLSVLFLISYYHSKDRNNSLADKAFVFVCFILPTAILACLFLSMANI